MKRALGPSEKVFRFTGVGVGLALLVIGRAVAEPSLELVPGLAAQVVQDHASGPTYLKYLH